MMTLLAVLNQVSSQVNNKSCAGGRLLYY